MDARRRRVVVVDDHVAFRTSAGDWLAGKGYDVVGLAGDGAEGVRLCAALEPDLVLLDVNLPDRSGVDVAGDLAALPEPPVVVLVSSDPAAAHDPTVLAAPAAGFLAKQDLACHEIDALLG